MLKKINIKRTVRGARGLIFGNQGRIAYFLFLLSLLLIPQPNELKPEAWRLFLIFIGTIIGIISQVFPIGTIAIFSISACTITRALTIQQTLSAFSSPIGWLIFTAFFLARGFIKTGLGTRIAYYLVRWFGKSTLGLSYSLVASEVFLSPITPSNTARGAGILFPIISALSRGLSSDPKNGTQRRLGSFLMVLGYQSNVLTCALFVTASACNPLLVQLAHKFDVHLTWSSWALAAGLPGLLSLFILPLALYKIFPPELKQTPEAPEFARKKLIEMGPMKPQEYKVAGIFLVLFVLWVFGPRWGIDATSASLLGLSLLLVMEILTFEDLLKESNAWNTFLWMSTLIMIGQALSDSGLIEWLGSHLLFCTKYTDWPASLLILVLLNFFIHYVFASTTAHISALYSMLVGVAISAGAPPVLSILALGYSSNLCAGITHYGTGPGPVYFGEGYVSLKDWWKLGAIIGCIYLVVWASVGPIWWRFLGLW